MKPVTTEEFKQFAGALKTKITEFEVCTLMNFQSNSLLNANVNFDGCIFISLFEPTFPNLNGYLWLMVEYCPMDYRSVVVFGKSSEILSISYLSYGITRTVLKYNTSLPRRNLGYFHQLIMFNFRKAQHILCFWRLCSGISALLVSMIIHHC